MSKNAKKVAKSPHGATPAIVALEKAGIAHTVHPYEHDPLSDLGYGLEAAQAIGIEPPRVFKTLMAAVDAHLVVAVVPVDRTLDLKALAHAAGGKKAVMAEQADAERATGYVVGGISPLGQRTAHTTIIDDSALGFDTVYVSGGRRGLDVGLAPSDLVAATRATTAPIARD
ncbi:Cys-tRNA(Pro)/Cys-tRNA(Cys) deacylase [Sanguibacter gelidistatuariae]|uniref:Cys-tRNA(Pro)/Cys-tRNA(Cys) deacylase n=1 Tax=Sanguibacter gelidistatuariae TaxID=1814289 RepID=A0A1G6WB99_9MICO|nr:Cys-tRNA(Pro) deacylase [Sanguibacter gelidistatuariae]SDD63111.1 Cys-tRNA(Pro)/Cys-tRNA(Cys) deacylase [Sanguibacter gelidistatuariae]